jgi:hypothetical protein
MPPPVTSQLLGRFCYLVRWQLAFDFGCWLIWRILVPSVAPSKDDVAYNSTDQEYEGYANAESNAESDFKGLSVVGV